MGPAAVLGRPAHAAAGLASLPGTRVDRTLDWRAGVEFDITFAPPAELAAAGYGSERARVLVRRAGDPTAHPLGPRRTWAHRNPGPGDTSAQIDAGRATGSLCLYYPRDPRALRWEWADGLEDFVGRVHRHLHCEEFHRREGRWPVEDAPHGHPEHRPKHPIRTPLMRKAVAAWT